MSANPSSTKTDTMAIRKLHSYLVTYRIHNGYMYNEPNGYDTTEEIIRTHNKEEAYEKASKRADTPSVIAHDPVTVLKKDVKRLPDEKLRNYVDFEMSALFV